MNREIVGVVTKEEKNEIMVLFERKLGIEELTATLEGDLLSSDKKMNMNNKITEELEMVKSDLRNCWGRMYEKYKWKGLDGHKWAIDFQTCEIYITDQI